MATETIIYDLEVLKSKEDQLGSISNDLANIKKTMRQLNEMVDDYWEGKTSEVFVAQNSKTIDKINALKTKVDTAKSHLSWSISKYSANESKNEGIVEDLSTEGIF